MSLPFLFRQCFYHSDVIFGSKANLYHGIIEADEGETKAPFHTWLEDVVRQELKKKYIVLFRHSSLPLNYGIFHTESLVWKILKSCTFDIIKHVMYCMWLLLTVWGSFPVLFMTVFRRIVSLWSYCVSVLLAAKLYWYNYRWVRFYSYASIWVNLILARIILTNRQM